MSSIGAIIVDATTGAGLLTACIALGGFIAHVYPALAGRDEDAIRTATVIGGLGGLGSALSIMFVAGLAA
jgi:hypothetical protein